MSAVGPFCIRRDMIFCSFFPTPMLASFVTFSTLVYTAKVYFIRLDSPLTLFLRTFSKCVNKDSESLGTGVSRHLNYSRTHCSSLSRHVGKGISLCFAQVPPPQDVAECGELVGVPLFRRGGRWDVFPVGGEGELMFPMPAPRMRNAMSKIPSWDATSVVCQFGPQD